MAEDCARGERLGWEEFVRDYSPIARALLAQYFPTLAPELDAHTTAVFQRARQDENAWFRGLSFTNEREFLMAFRDLAFAYARGVGRLPAPELSLAQVQAIMQNLPVVEREILWLFIKGYDAARIASMMMNAESTAAAVTQVAGTRLREILPAASEDAFVISARVLIEAAEKTRGNECLPLRTFNNLVNGQITWREREVAEQHIAACMYCLDRFTSFQEMIRIRKDAQPATAAEREAILANLNLPPAAGRGLLRRLFAS